MRSKKKITWVVMLLSLLLVLTGCSENQQVIFDAALKMQNVTSLQQQTTMTFKLSGSGFDPAVQQQVDMATAFVNNAKLDLKAKTSGNEEKTINKSQVDINLAMQGMNIAIPIWVDSDLASSTPKVTEIVKLPQIAAASLPPQFASKQYMVLNPYTMAASGQSNLDMSKLAALGKSMQLKQVEFLTSFSKRFNPDIKVVSKGSQDITTSEGTKLAELYEVKLNDSQLKDFVRYTVNNFANDKEAMLFVKEFMDSILEVSQVPEQAKTLSEFDQAFEEFNVNMQASLDKFNGVMDQLKGVTILGDQGIAVQYAIVNGYVVKESGTIDLKVDLAQINQLINTLNAQQGTPPDAKGNLNLIVNFSTVTSDINTPVEIQIPEVNETNSFDYMDLIKTFIPNHSRVAGQDGYKTARAIGEEYSKGGQCTSIILASGVSFPDALSSGILSRKFNAPILLVGSTVEESSEAFDFIASHSNPDTKFYIIGGTGIIGTSFETELGKLGHANIERLSGFDRYDTGMAVVEKANVEPGTPVFVISGESFPDVLSASSIAGAKQYPTLLAGQNYLADKTKAYLKNNKPSTVYIVGGVSAVSQSVEDQIKELAPTAIVNRLAGNDRFDTAGVILNQFSSSPQTVYLANGFNFQDAIAGSALAAKTGDPVLLIDHTLGTLPPATEAYLKKLREAGKRPMVRALGGVVVVPDLLIKQAENILDGK